MKNIVYDPYRMKKSDVIPENILKLIRVNHPYFEEKKVNLNIKVSKVNSPFIMAENILDIDGCNNDMYDYNVKRIKYVQFTGGNCLIEFVKTGEDAYIIHGNYYEGYNIFLFN